MRKPVIEPFKVIQAQPPLRSPIKLWPRFLRVINDSANNEGDKKTHANRPAQVKGALAAICLSHSGQQVIPVLFGTFWFSNSEHGVFSPQDCNNRLWNGNSGLWKSKS